MTAPAAHDALANYAGLEKADLRPFGAGLINDTFLVDKMGERFVLQRVNPIFSPRIHENIAAVTSHLEKHGFATPHLVPATQGEAFVQVENEGTWRLMTFIEGATFDAVQSHEQARAAGKLVGGIHTALDDLEYEFQDVRLGVHDTAAHLRKLRGAAETHYSHALHTFVHSLAQEVFDVARTLDRMPPLPNRICHGDLKFNNIRFGGERLPERDRALCLIDLDTVGPMHLGYEMGDALRSWCNRSGEDGRNPSFDVEVFQASLEGYIEGLGRPLSNEEKRAFLLGVEWVSLELTARFAADTLLETYFGWDSERYETRGRHNLVRARGQWALFHAAHETRDARSALLGLS